ncbi:hypothetical protein [Neisseria musculi]|uniref:hypothetical protein n=1 Tax=Neisseria musculi TaxID=1815583 RepID=UPI0036082492
MFRARRSNAVTEIKGETTIPATGVKGRLKNINLSDGLCRRAADFLPARCGF